MSHAMTKLEAGVSAIFLRPTRRHHSDLDQYITRQARDLASGLKVSLEVGSVHGASEALLKLDRLDVMRQQGELPVDEDLHAILAWGYQALADLCVARLGGAS